MVLYNKWYSTIVFRGIHLWALMDSMVLYLCYSAVAIGIGQPTYSKFPFPVIVVAMM